MKHILTLALLLGAIPAALALPAVVPDSVERCNEIISQATKLDEILNLTKGLQALTQAQFQFQQQYMAKLEQRIVKLELALADVLSNKYRQVTVEDNDQNNVIKDLVTRIEQLESKAAK